MNDCILERSGGWRARRVAAGPRFRADVRALSRVDAGKVAEVFRCRKCQHGSGIAAGRWALGYTGQNGTRLIARQAIRVDPFSELHHQCTAWILSG
jgi:hypothetical protein